MAGERSEIVSMISNETRMVLDVGCASGEVGKAIKDKCKCEVTGIEIDRDQAKKASTKIDHVITGDVEALDLRFQQRCFDYIVFADVLEHLKDPLSALKKYLIYLKEGGKVIVSIPNVRHISVLYELIMLGEWK